MAANKDRFGINIMKYCREHELYIEEQLANGADRKQLLLLHEKKLEWLQHERLVHLIVTVFTGVIFLFTILFEYLTQSQVVFLFMAVSFIMLSAYLIHYFRLENHVQHWYMIAQRLNSDIINEKGNNNQK